MLTEEARSDRSSDLMRNHADLRQAIRVLRQVANQWSNVYDAGCRLPLSARGRVWVGDNIVKLREKKLKFASRDGLTLHGTLATPPGKISGVMLMVHGITSDRSEWGIASRSEVHT